MMAVSIQNTNGHIQNQLTKSLEKILEEANQSGELKLSNRKLKDFPRCNDKFNLIDTVTADLSKNRFNELPEEVTGFPFLEKLNCYHNTIRYIPDTVVTLQCLRFLDLSRNQLTTLPREICQLPIQILLISNNSLASLPDELCRMNQLTELDASCNQLTHLPSRMGELKALRSLVLRNNLLLAVPIEITFLYLTRIDIRANRIGVLPIEMRDMTTLIELLVEDNPLTSPPASLCKRGRVHIFKYLENEAIRLDRKTGGTTSGTNSACGTLGRRTKKHSGNLSPGPPLLAERLKQKRHNVDSGYSTCSDGCGDKRWSQEIDLDKQWTSPPISSTTSSELNCTGGNSSLSTPSTVSPAPETSSFEDVSTRTSNDHLNNEQKPFGQIQTYREYKEALKQQRAHDVPSIYRTKDSNALGDDTTPHTKTEPNTPTHHSKNGTVTTPTSGSLSSLATSKSDPTPLNSVLMARTVQDTSPKRVVKLNGAQRYNVEYARPKGPVANDTGSGGRIMRTLYSTKAVNGMRMGGTRSGSTTAPWMNGKDGVASPDKLTFTMRREIDKAKEENELINQLRNIIETRLKMALPEDLAPALTDGVVLCHLANHIRPRSVASIHVPSPAVPKLTMARCRRNVDNFIEACRKIGVDENLLCCAADVLEGRGLVQIAVTVVELLRFHLPRSPLHTTANSTIV